MKNQLSPLVNNSLKAKELFKPLFFRLKIPSDKQKLQELISTNPGIQVYDEIVSQVEELIKSRNPKTIFSKDSLHQEALEYLNHQNQEEYGTWVYYPWNNKLVHLLDEKEFIEVRTNRNHYKISLEEKEILANKKIGIIGLSVGHSIAMTIATERICGELRIADFDVIELSNLNRIRTSVYNLGCSKVVTVAREIAELDPYLKVIPFIDGLTENNMDEFFVKNGKLDLCVEVCDGIDIKIVTRQKAKELRIPVVMNTSDRGSTDVERFDLNPNLSLLHGLADHLDLTKLKDAKTNEEKIPYVISLIGLDTTSARLKASMLEIAESINTWPQLASAVVLGGGIVADVSRRVLLNQFTDSGRYFVDLEEIFSDKETDSSERFQLYETSSLSNNELIEIISKNSLGKNKDQAHSIPVDLIQKIVTAGIQAPLAWNNQPWKFAYINGVLYVFINNSNSILEESAKMLSSIAVGSVIENMTLAAHQLKLGLSVQLQPIESEKRLIASIQFYENDKINGTEHHLVDHLSNYINTVISTKNIQYREKLDQKIVEDFKSISSTISGNKIQFVQTTKEQEEISQIIGKAEKLRILYPEVYAQCCDPFGLQDFFQNLKSDNSVNLDDLNITPSEYLSMKISSDPKVISLLKNWKKGGGIEKLSRTAVEASSKVGLITIPDLSDDSLINGGRAAQRLQLLARKHNLLLKAYYSPFLLTANPNGQIFQKFNSEVQQELKLIRERFLSIFPDNNKSIGMFLFSLNISKISTNKSFSKTFNKDLFINYP